MDYDKKIEEARYYATLVSKTYNEVLEISKNSRNKRKFEKQKKLFHQFVLVKEDFQKYKAKTKSNFKGVKKDRFFSATSTMSDVRKKLESKGYTFKEIKPLNDKLNNANSLEEMLDILTQEYKHALYSIENYKKMKEASNKPKETTPIETKHTSTYQTQYTSSTYTTTYSTPQKTQVTQPKKEEVRAVDGPKSPSLMDRIKGKDVNIEDIKLLYGLAADILVLMEHNLQLEVKTGGAKTTFANVQYIIALSKLGSFEKDLFQKYGVSSIDELLNKYEWLRNKYYKIFSKMKAEQKSKYNLSSFSSHDIQSSISDSLSSHVDSSLLRAMQNEGLSFPPSAAELKAMINRRVLNGKSFPSSQPKTNGEEYFSEPENMELYNKDLAYYKNLVKYMRVEEIKELYNIVMRQKEEYRRFSDDSDEKFLARMALLQRLFAEVVIEKKDMRYADHAQYEDLITQVIKKDLDTELKFAPENTDITEKKAEERRTTIYKEYLKYYASKEDKKEVMGFIEFANAKYGVKITEAEQAELEETAKKSR